MVYFLRRALAPAVAVGLLLAATPRAHAWAHQGHILITRLAALRIINDPGAPAGLRDFLRANMPYDLEECRKLAISQIAGEDGKGPGGRFLSGLDGACTLPDRIGLTEEGKKDLQPYGAPEGKMHYTDLEWLGKDPTYKADLSNRPNLADVPRDMKDPRWKMAGYVPFRIEECYQKVVAAFGSADKPVENDAALHWTGYLVHYIEDCYQPHHSTVDFKSFSYLAGKNKAVHEIKVTTSEGRTYVSYRSDDRWINPHGDLEFRLFDDTDEPRATWRKEFWSELTARMESQAKAAMDPNRTPRPKPCGSFDRALEILADSYDYLPAVGKAAAAGYAKGDFDAAGFFTSQDTVHGEKMDTVQLIAERNAAAVLEVERTLRQAWAQARNSRKQDP